MMILRPYQQDDIARIRAAYANGARRVLLASPTASGKTFLFATVVAGVAKRGKRVTILGHRDEIIRQIDDALTELGVAHGIIAAGYPSTPELPVQIASVATLVRRLHRLAPAPDFCVVDEAHHAAARTWGRIIEVLPEARILGVTATPQRLDGKGLSDIFDTLIIGPSVEVLIQQGYLSNFTTYAPAQRVDLSKVHTRAGDYALDELAETMSAGVIIEGAVDEYVRLCAGVPAICFAVDIAHSKLVAAAFAARGFRAAHVDGTTPAAERRALIAALGTGEIQVLCNCGLISEGLDVPVVTAAILLRPTKSPALHLQQVGRALRPAPGKAKALILDHTGNTFRFGPADVERRWSLEGKAGKGEALPPLQRCFGCGAIIPAAAMICPECGTVLRVPEPKAPHVERAGTTLVATDRLATMTYQQALRWAGGDRDRLRLVAAARGYKPGWIYYRLQELREAAAITAKGM
jgi:superfamily II DNA or RNA helicase